MKKFLVLMTALALLAFALPALAQIPPPTINIIAQDANDVNGNGTAIGNTSGILNDNEGQFAGSKIGDQSGAGSFMNKSIIAVDGLGSNNTVNWNASQDNSNATLLNKSPVLVYGTGNENRVFTDNSGVGSILNKSAVTVDNVGNNNVAAIGGLNAQVTLDAVDSGNNNQVFVGDMTSAHQFEYQFTHQFEHQLNFGDTFNNADGMFFMPLTPVHLQQANTGISTGDNAGAVGGIGNISQVNMTGAVIAGMAGASANMGGVAQNQAASNVVTAFSR